jgi:hypothetical protein
MQTSRNEVKDPQKPKIRTHKTKHEPTKKRRKLEGCSLKM